MTRFRSICFMATLLAFSFANAAEAESQSVQYIHDGKPYPPVFYLNHVPDDDFEKAVEETKAFSNLSENVIGYPIGLRTWASRDIQSDGAAVTSAFLAGSTLGLVPLVANKRFIIHYQIIVQGEVIETIKYEFNHTDADNLWTAAKKHSQLRPEEKAFLLNSIPRFFNDLKSAEEVQSIFEEYYRYYGNTEEHSL